MEINTDALIAEYNTRCRRRNQPVYAAIVHHHCTPSCKLYHLKTLADKTPLFICTYSRNIHVCGHGCIHAQVTPRSESIVCGLTGWVLPVAVEKNYATMSTNTSNVTTYTNSSTIVMGTHTKPKNHSKRAPAYTTLPLQTVVDALYVFFGVNKHSDSTQTKRHIKVRFPITFTALQKQLFQSVAMDPEPITPIRVQKLAKAIVRFYAQLGMRWSLSGKNIATFTAVVLSKLRTGYAIKTVEMFPRVDWITQHAPYDVEFAGMLQIKCRAMSTLWRKIQQLMVCPQSGIPIHTKLFSLALS